MTPRPVPAAPTPRSAVVTGAARGIGRGIAELLVTQGYAVVVTDVDGEAVQATAREIGAVAGLAHDVRDPQAHRTVAWRPGSTTPGSATTGDSRSSPRSRCAAWWR